MSNADYRDGGPPSLWEGLTPPYRTIVADPPWMYQKDAGAKSGGQGPSSMAEAHYSTMTNEEIAALPVTALAGPAAHLYLWFTNPGVWGGRFSDVTPKDIAEAWGFEFKTVLTWVKPGAGGMGWFFRGQTEHVLFATRGGPDAAIPAEKREPNVIDSRRGKGHSGKPAAFFDLVERVSPGPYVELFARAPRLGWDSWGKGYEADITSGGGGLMTTAQTGRAADERPQDPTSGTPVNPAPTSSPLKSYNSQKPGVSNGSCEP